MNIGVYISVFSNLGSLVGQGDTEALVGPNEKLISFECIMHFVYCMIFCVCCTGIYN